MADTNKETKPSFTKGVKGEFRKIIWPSKDALTKQTIAVVSITVVLSIIISLVDKAIQYGLNFIIK